MIKNPSVCFSSECHCPLPSPRRDPQWTSPSAASLWASSWGLVCPAEQERSADCRRVKSHAPSATHTYTYYYTTVWISKLTVRVFLLAGEGQWRGSWRDNALGWHMMSCRGLQTGLPWLQNVSAETLKIQENRKTVTTLATQLYINISPHLSKLPSWLG